MKFHTDWKKKNDCASPLILCCASVGRSGQAVGYLAAQGIECVNGGSWMTVKLL